MIKASSQLLRIFLMAVALCGSAAAADIDALQGKWKADKEINGEKATFNLEIKQALFRFELKGSDGGVRLFLMGKIKLEKRGSFNTLTLHEVEAGRSESEVRPIEDTRSFVYVNGGGSLTLAGNFDRERANEEPNLTVYRKQ
jgi:hypothetical protein